MKQTFSVLCSACIYRDLLIVCVPWIVTKQCWNANLHTSWFSEQDVLVLAQRHCVIHTQSQWVMSLLLLMCHSNACTYIFIHHCECNLCSFNCRYAVWQFALCRLNCWVCVTASFKDIVFYPVHCYAFTRNICSSWQCWVNVDSR